MKPKLCTVGMITGVISLFALLPACSGGGGPTAITEHARISGVLTGAPMDGTLALADGEDGGPFSGGTPLSGVSVRLVDGSGNILFDGETDATGGFDMSAPAGTYLLEVVLADGSTFTLEVTAEEGQHVVVEAEVEREESGDVINAQIFTDEDGDGASDTGFRVQIVGREAGQPDSGEETEVAEERDEEDEAVRGEGERDGDEPAGADEEEGCPGRGEGGDRGADCDNGHGNGGDGDEDDDHDESNPGHGGGHGPGGGNGGRHEEEPPAAPDDGSGEAASPESGD